MIFCLIMQEELNTSCFHPIFTQSIPPGSLTTKETFVGVSLKLSEHTLKLWQTVLVGPQTFPNTCCMSGTKLSTEDTSQEAPNLMSDCFHPVCSVSILETWERLPGRSDPCSEFAGWGKWSKECIPGRQRSGTWDSLLCMK